jgi:hypothetical protein
MKARKRENGWKKENVNFGRRKLVSTAVVGIAVLETDSWQISFCIFFLNFALYTELLGLWTSSIIRNSKYQAQFCLGSYSDFNRNEYHVTSWSVKGDLRVRVAMSLP